MEKFINIIIPAATSLVTFLLTHLYHRREAQNDLETKLTNRIEEITLKMIELNEKYLKAIDQINDLKQENRVLKRKIEELQILNH